VTSKPMWCAPAARSSVATTSPNFWLRRPLAQVCVVSYADYYMKCYMQRDTIL
jgi:hypothetical protein